MRKLIRALINNGVPYGTDLIQRRRIRLLNVFNAACAVMVFFFFLANLAVGSTSHGFIVLSGIVLVTIPVVLLNRTGNINIAKYYLVICAVAFSIFIGFKSIDTGYNRDNGYFLLGFSAIIITLFDNPVKRILFLLVLLSGLYMKYYRLISFGTVSNDDTILTLVNVMIGYLCVYWFTDIFKEDLINSEKRIKRFSVRGASQSQKILEQKEAIQSSQELLYSTINNIPVFIAKIDPEGKFILVNHRFSEVLLKSKAEMVGKRFGQIFQKDIVELTKPLFDKALNGQTVEINYPYTFPSGDFIHAFGKFIPLFDASGEVHSVLTYVIDIKELKASEKALREVNTSKDKILSILSHDLRSPINSLSGLLNISGDISEKDFKNLIGNIGRQVDTLSFTLNNILNWVKTQLEGFETSQKLINVYEVVKSCADLYYSQLEEKAIELHNEIENDVSALVDPDHLSMVMRNLINNAVKFTPEKGKIKLSSWSDHKYLHVKVEDTGIGMDQALIDSFASGISQLKPMSSVGTNGEKGTGLGLGFCMDLLELNHAHMNVISEKGKGTSITVALPTA